MTGRLKLAPVFLGLLTASAQQTSPAKHDPDVPYVATPQDVVNAMLEVARVKPTDVVYDLGCGDGRIVITAVNTYHAHGVCVEINPDLIQQARRNAEQAGADKMIEFRQADFFQTDIHDATVVTLFLLPRINLALRPKLQHDLKPGSRIVSQAFDMGDWKPNALLSLVGSEVYLWIIPKPK